MIPGTTTKLSEAGQPAADIIDVKTDIIWCGNAAVAIPIRILRPHFGGGNSGFVCFFNVGSTPLEFINWTSPTNPGNIALNNPLLLPQWTAVWFVYSSRWNAWFASQTP